ncbi:MAG: ChaN family lipoprotein [Gammaproteobacteria bacterium]|jgi:uncharacterized iron-regulated protein|nr:ChaN family lipoprotein [Gammaproteobacteria bacterium]
MNIHFFSQVFVALFAVGLLACEPSTDSYAKKIHAVAVAPTAEDSLEHTAAPVDVRAIDLSALPDLDAIIPQLAQKQVVFVGEIHDRFGHHLAQLEIIKRLHRAHSDLAIGVEYFQRSSQPHLDAYIAGELDEKGFLKKTEYFERWSFDYRLYRPIFRYARKHNIPLVALNIPTEISRKVALSGLGSLTDDEKAQVTAQVDKSDLEYRELLRAVFEEHRQRNTELDNFDYFVEAQLLWDESMADNATGYLREYPQRHLVILAGNGHLVYGSGIPRRLLRRLPVTSATVINASGQPAEPDMADFLVFPPKVTLPSAGLLGIYMQKKETSVVVEDLVPQGGAAKAGLTKGDQLVAIHGEAIETLGDVKIALLDKRPGDRINITVKRDASSTSPEVLEFEVVLTAHQ